MSDKTIYEALAAAQAEMQNPRFDRVNPHLKSAYASLAAVRDAVVPVLAKHGIAIIQNVQYVGDYVEVTTLLCHGTDQLSFGPLKLPPTKHDVQGIGSAATYGKRYALMGIACVAGDEDTDGEDGSKEDLKETAYRLYEDKHLQPLREAAMRGTKALEAEFSKLPDDPMKARMWQIHKNRLKEGAALADKGAA